MQHPEEFLLMEPRLEEVPIPDEAYDSVYLEMIELWPARSYQKFQYWPRKDPRGQVKRRGYQGHLPPHSETDPNPPVQQPPPAVNVIINPPPLPPKPKRGLAIPASQPDLFGQAIQAVITVPGPSQRLSTDRHTHANSPSVVAPPKRTAHTPKGPVKSKVTVVATPGTPGHPGKTTVTVGGAGGSAGVVSPYAAKRLNVLLQGVVSEYEKRFGVLNVEGAPATRRSNSYFSTDRVCNPVTMSSLKPEIHEQRTLHIAEVEERVASE